MKFFIASFFSIILSFASSPAHSACPKGEFFVKAHHRRAYQRADGTYVRDTNVRAHCKALTVGDVFANDRFQNVRPPGWPHKSEKFKIWTEADRRQLAAALDDVPEFLLSKNVKGFYRAAKSQFFSNPASSAEGMMILYDSAFGPNQNLPRIVSHELAHQNFSDLSGKEQADYRRAAGWTLQDNDGIVVWYERPDGYVEEDGRNSYYEDYANNLEYYIYNPDKLKKVSPDIYEWMKSSFEIKLSKGGRK